MNLTLCFKPGLFLFSKHHLSLVLSSPLSFSLCTVRSHPAIEISLLSVLTRSTALTMITASCKTALALHDQAPWCVNVCACVCVNCKVCMLGLMYCSCSRHACHYCCQHQRSCHIVSVKPGKATWILSLRLPPVREDSSRHQVNATR